MIQVRIVHLLQPLLVEELHLRVDVDFAVHGVLAFVAAAAVDRLAEAGVWCRDERPFQVVLVIWASFLQRRGSLRPDRIAEHVLAEALPHGLVNWDRTRDVI